MPLDIKTITATLERVRVVSRGRLDYEEVAALHELLRGHLAVLLDDARELAEGMPRESFDRNRMEIHIGRLTALHDRPLAPGPGTAFSDVRQLANGCTWLLTQLDTRASA